MSSTPNVPLTGPAGEGAREGAGGGGDRPVLGGVQAAVACLGKALTQDLWRLQGTELGHVLQGLDQVRRDTERLILGAVGEAAGWGAAGMRGSVR